MITSNDVMQRDRVRYPQTRHSQILEARPVSTPVLVPALVWAAATLLCGSLFAAPDPTNDWPNWSGPRGDLTVPAEGVFDDGGFGLAVAWRKDLGSAYSGIAVVGDRLVTGYSDGEHDFVVALDAMSGDELWRYRVAETYKGHDGSDDGLIATPTIDDGKVFGLGPWGQLFALRLSDGEELWAHKIDEEFGAIKPDYGFSTTPTVIGGVLVVQTGGRDGRSISALDPESGILRWSTGEDTVAYQSPMPIEIDGQEKILAVTDHQLIALEPADGEVLFSFEHSTDEHGYSQPVPVGDDGVVLHYWNDTALFRIAKTGGGPPVEEVWRSNAMRTTYAIPVPHDGLLYGLSGRFLTAVDAQTGETVWKSREPHAQNLVVVDEHLIIQTRDGEIAVAEASAEGYREKARLPVLDTGYLTAPTFAAGRIYVRNLSQIASLDITDAPREASAPEVAEAERSLLGSFGNFVRRVEDAPADERAAMVDEFLVGRRSFPLVEGDSLVHFVVRGEFPDLVLLGNMLDLGENRPMHRVDGTDLYFHSMELPPGAVFTYNFGVFEDVQTDPGNPVSLDAGIQLSVLEMPGFEPADHLAEPDGARGEIESLTWKSESLENEREVQVYLPPGYAESDQRLPLLVVYLGDQALAVGRIQNTLDNLIGESVEPLVAAFVPRLRWHEMGGSQVDRFTAALTEELLPRLEADYRLREGKGSRAVMGPGSAGWAAVYAAFKRPAAFGKAAAQSFYLGDLRDELFELIEKKPELEILLGWSRNDYHREFPPTDARGDSERLVETLRAAGYEPTTYEVEDGAGWTNWRLYTDRILEAFFPLGE